MLVNLSNTLYEGQVQYAREQQNRTHRLDKAKSEGSLRLGAIILAAASAKAPARSRSTNGPIA